MASITWRGRYLGRGGQVMALLLAVVVVSMFFTVGFREPCSCPNQSVPTRLDHKSLNFSMLLPALQDNHRTASENAVTADGDEADLRSTAFPQGEQVFDDLKPEKNALQANDETDPGLPDIMSNLSLADIKHMTWGDDLDVEAFTAWAEFHVTSNISNNFLLPEFLIRAQNACTSETELIVLMPSVPEHVFVRELVRQTWAGSLYGMPWPRRRLHLKTSLVFMLGTYGLPENKLNLLKEESDDYGDLVTASFVDSYRNLTLKMITGLEWVAQYCPSASYILKCDLDTFVNLPLMTRLLKSVGEKLPRFVFGGRHETLNPPVLRSGRWSISLEEYPFPVFPPYVMGHSYVLTAGLAPQMVRLAHKIPTVPSEDSFITGVLACILKATRLYHDAFANNFKRPLPCNIVFNEDVSMTKMSVSHLLLMWRHVLTNSCSARELTPRANMVTQQGKKKHQQLTILNQKQQAQPDLREKQMQAEEWKNPWQNNNKNNLINFNQPQQQKQLEVAPWQNHPQINRLQFNQELQRQEQSQDVPLWKLQQRQMGISKDALDNPWQIPDFDKNIHQ
ncbi:beta-1,3-galactosyltransferase 1-like [Elysia marginata]|uniref:Beta-1,3-galactosyltransferase 1-like n=1 Tax=Elysia marginata TaxID=1093978 RepID=A0AAV4EWU9_9GAST|nr:beta-1,3-galactosyltransferase 1-like [Elysia marginata]